MASFGYLKHKKKPLEFAWQHFESKLILIQWLDEDYWIIVMYLKYITYNFFMAIGPHVYGLWKIIKQKKNEKII
jgi:hypothetical protein